MDAICERCEEMGCNDCDSCSRANPCYGCELEGKCHGECAGEPTSNYQPCDGKCDNPPTTVENCQHYFMGMCMDDGEEQGACPV